jgi:hypothetical protein
MCSVERIYSFVSGPVDVRCVIALGRAGGGLQGYV